MNAISAKKTCACIALAEHQPTSENQSGLIVLEIGRTLVRLDQTLERFCVLRAASLLGRNLRPNFLDDLGIKRKHTMHYRNGREAKNGDKIVQLSMDDKGQVTAVGLLYNATPGNDYCNGNIAPIQPAAAGACMCDCLHLDDLAAILAEKGLNKRPSGK